MTNWYDKYVNIPYKHLGNDIVSGMDCFNLCRYIYKQELDIEIPHLSFEHCNIVDNDWYNKTNTDSFRIAVEQDNRCLSVTNPAIHDFIFMSIGSTNVTNHCAMFLGSNKIIHTMIGRSSWVSPYGTYYKQYTTGIYRWTT
jgi:cell wall-associated NlpC family hydrolase